MGLRRKIERGVRERPTPGRSGGIIGGIGIRLASKEIGR